MTELTMEKLEVLGEALVELEADCEGEADASALARRLELTKEKGRDAFLKALQEKWNVRRQFRVDTEQIMADVPVEELENPLIEGTVRRIKAIAEVEESGLLKELDTPLRESKFDDTTADGCKLTFGELAEAAKKLTDLTRNIRADLADNVSDRFTKAAAFGGARAFELELRDFWQGTLEMRDSLSELDLPEKVKAEGLATVDMSADTVKLVTEAEKDPLLQKLSA